MSDTSIDALYADHLQTLMQRTDKALGQTGHEALVIHAGVPPVLFLDDQDYPFKVNPHFKAWVPVTDNPRCLLIYRPGQRPTLLFHRPQDFWHKPAALPTGAWTKSVDLEPFADEAKVQERVAALRKAAFVGPAAAAIGFEPAQVNPEALLQHLHYDRAVKTPYELACMRQAAQLGAVGHLAALAAFRGGGSEYEAHMCYLEACRQREEEMPYNNIVAYNENAAVLHYQHLERSPPAVLRSFLIDAGAQFRGYASDITRTYAADEGAFADLVAALDHAQLKLCAEIRPGRDYREVHLSAHRLLGAVLHDQGISRLNGEAALEAGVTSAFFPHGIGHLLGLQVHDVGGVMGDVVGQERPRPAGHPWLRLTRLLEPGVVVTVEPGIYFIDSLLAQAHGDGRRAHIDWERGRGPEALRRDPHRGQRRDHDRCT